MKRIVMKANAAIFAALFAFSLNSCAVSNSKSVARQTADSFVEDYSEGRYEKMLSEYELDPELVELLTVPVMQGVWEQTLISFCGPFKNIDFDHVVFDKTADTYTYPFIFEYQTAMMMVGAGEDGKIFSFVLCGFENTQVRSFPENLVSIDVTFGDPAFILKGTFVHPVDGKSLSCAILVADSGSLALGRFGLTGPNSVYYDIALGLANKGIAVLLYDLRQYAYGAAAGDNLSIEEEYLDDINYAISFAKNQDCVDENNIFVIGHGVGAYMLPLLSNYSEISAKGLVLLSMNSSHLEDLYVGQYKTLATITGSISPEDEMGIKAAEETAQKIKSITEENAEYYSGTDLLGHSPYYWMNLNELNAPQVMAALEQKMLFCYAEFDYKVPLSELEPYKKALANKTNAQIIVFDGVNHQFMPASKLEGPQSYYSPAKVDNRLIEAITGFIEQ